MMNIAILGAGRVGGSLGKLWAAKGHQVVFGVRDPSAEKVRSLLAETQRRARAASVAEAAASGEVIVLALGWPAVEEVLRALHDWTGKIIIDATNRNIMAAESVPSAAEDVARLAPGAKVVKAFNTLGADQFAQARFGNQTASMFICGDDSGAKSTVAALTAELGFEVVDCGPLANAAWLEALAKLWIYLARNQTGREVAFKLLRR